MTVLQRNATSSGLPPVVRYLLIANIGLFLLEQVKMEALLEYFALWPTVHSIAYGRGPNLPGFEPWQLISYAFLHGSWTHLLFNMYALWFFGAPMENAWGSRRFLLYYLVCVIGAGITQLMVAGSTGEIYPTIGASGGVFGLLLAFGVIYPDERLMLLFPPVVMKAKWFVIVFGALELLFGVTGAEQGVAHFAHLGGMLFGYLLLVYWRSASPPLR